MSGATVRQVGDDEIGGLTSALRSLYVGAYVGPPYNEGPEQADDFITGLADQRQRQGFRMVGAFAPDGSLIGFAYGATFAADRWWRSADAEPAAIAGKSKFAVFELIVHPAWQGQHLASALMSSLLDGRDEPYATLCANPAAHARAIYDWWGWTKVGTTRPPGIGDMDVLLKPLLGVNNRSIDP